MSKKVTLIAAVIGTAVVLYLAFIGIVAILIYFGILPNGFAGTSLR